MADELSLAIKQALNKLGFEAHISLKHRRRQAIAFLEFKKIFFLFWLVFGASFLRSFENHGSRSSAILHAQRSNWFRVKYCFHLRLESVEIFSA